MEQQIQPSEKLPSVLPAKEVLETSHQQDLAINTAEEADIQALLARTKREVRISTFFTVGIVGTTLLFFLSLILMLFAIPFFSKSAMNTLFPFVLIGLFGIPIFLLITNLSLRSWMEGNAQAKSLKRLFKFKDLGAVGPLAEILWAETTLLQPFASYRHQSPVAQALLHLLPQMKPSDAPLLNSAQREKLHQWLLYPEARGWVAMFPPPNAPHISQDRSKYQSQYIERWKPLALVLLQAYQQIGDERDRPAVVQLVKGEGFLASDPEIRAAAKDCLPFLQDNTKRSQTSQTLLRASDPTTAAPAELLRAADTAGSTAPQQLLRPTTAENQGNAI